MIHNNYLCKYKVCICKLFSNVCLFVDIEKILFTNQIADQVKKSFLTVCMMRVITFFLREIFDIETRFCGRVRGQNFYNSFYNKLLVHCRGAGMSKLLVRTSLYMMGIICHWLESKSLYVSHAVSHFYGTEF